MTPRRLLILIALTAAVAGATLTLTVIAVTQARARADRNASAAAVAPRSWIPPVCVDPTTLTVRRVRPVERRYLFDLAACENRP